jgi:lysozyme
MSTPQSTLPSGNRNLKLSDQGKNDLMRHEGVIHHYYNDSVHNCTYGAGTLVHLGPCAEAEMHTTVTPTMIVKGMQGGVDSAQTAVYRSVTHYQLTQDQFDALVSFTYNVGGGGARSVFQLVDQGKLAAAADKMMEFVNATVYGPDRKPLRDQNGKIITRVLPGLVRRRREESAPFRKAQSNAPRQ